MNGAPWEIVAWRTGTEWTQWHVARPEAERVLCGLTIPARATRRRGAAVRLEEVCRTCLGLLAKEEDA